MVPARAPRPDLDFTPLTGWVGPWTRLRALAGQPTLVIPATIAGLMLAGAIAALVTFVVVGFDHVAASGYLFALVPLAGALWLGLDLWVSTGATGAFARFARVNGLVHLAGITVPHYASRVFAGGSHLVAAAVRTRDATFLEVGDRFPTTVPFRGDATYAEPALYLRARLSGRAGTAPYGVPLVTPELEEELTALAGEHTVEVTGDELTVLGSSPLGPTGPGRVERAFDLVDALAARADQLLVRLADEGPTASGVPIPELAPPEVVEGRPASALTVVVLTLALVTVLPLGLALVMSQVGGSLRGHEGAATLAVGAFVALCFALVALLIRTVSRPRRPRTRRRG